MGKKIGIPRSLFYFKFITLWETFFNHIGAEVIVSDPTNKRILEDGVKACVDEACIPIKLFHGHVINLKDRVEYIFVPRFTSISKWEYICPEFGGLPDIVRHTMKGLPHLIDTEINMRNSEKGADKAAVETASFLGVGARTAREALKAALESFGRFKQEAMCGTLPFCKFPLVSGQKKLCIALIGHPYNIFDEYISMNLIGKLNKFGFDVVTIEMVDEKDINNRAAGLNKPMFWNFGRNAYGAAVHLADEGEIAGMICISSFGCGIDSMVCDLIERKIRRVYQIPFIILTMDEHSGEAGFDTRLEAFIDMLYWRRHHEFNISALG